MLIRIMKSSLLAIVSLMALAQANAVLAATPSLNVVSAAVDPAGSSLVIRGAFGTTAISATLGSVSLACPTVGATEIRCDLPSGAQALSPGTYRLELFAVAADEKVVTTAGNERPVQFKSALDVSIGLRSHTDVREFGARGDGVTDDTTSIQNAIDSTRPGGVVFLPAGNYLISAPLLVSKRLVIEGDGIGTQVFQMSDFNLLEINNVRGATIRGLYLGSAATAPGTSLVRLLNSHNNRLDEITMLGGHYGIHLQGSLLNTLVNVRSGVNIGGFFSGACSVNQYWVYLERHNSISANANTFVAPSLEGGTRGIWMTDSNFEGNLFVYGGTIEGVADTGLFIGGTFLPVMISGVHFEANGIADIHVANAANVTMEGILATKMVLINGLDANRPSRNVRVNGSVIDRIEIGQYAIGTQLTGILFNITGAGGITDAVEDTYYQYVQSNAIGVVNQFGPVNWYSSVGIGVRNPNANPVGLTPGRRLEVKGQVRADSFVTTP